MRKILVSILAITLALVAVVTTSKPLANQDSGESLQEIIPNVPRITRKGSSTPAILPSVSRQETDYYHYNEEECAQLFSILALHCQ